MEILHHYENDHNLESARIIVPAVLSIVHAESVIDIGCGIGSWLAAYKEHGVKNILGLDGAHVPRKMLKIDSSLFKEVDLRDLSSIKINMKYDLVNCLEVAEHLPKGKAIEFVEFLVSLGDVIVFSAAVPGQTGENHINEQFPDYWEKLFNDKGFVFLDPFRRNNWNNESIAWWYRQNMFLVVRKASGLQKQFDPFDGNSYIHPELLNLYIEMHKNNDTSVCITGKAAAKIACQAVLKKMFGKAKWIIKKNLSTIDSIRLSLYGLSAFNNISTHLTREEKLILHGEASRTNGVFVEIGSYVGASTCAICQGVKNKSDTVVYCIDTWENQGMKEGFRDTFSEFQKNTSSFKDKIITLRGYSADKIKDLMKHNIKIDFLFVDGDHSYEGVKQDWDLYSPLLNEKAIVIMHDYGWATGVQKVINEDIRPLIASEKILPNMYIGWMK